METAKLPTDGLRHRTRGLAMKQEQTNNSNDVRQCDECGAWSEPHHVHWCAPSKNLLLCRERIAELEAKVGELEAQLESQAEYDYEGGNA